jgi:S1-C subfamily serine protease
MDDQTTRPKRATRSLILPLTLAAVLGGGVAAASVVAVGGTDGSSTPATVTVGAAATTSSGNPAVAATSAPVTAPAAAAAGVKSVAQIYRDAAPGVVRVTQAQGQGSGFVIDSEGHILTNAHVVDGAGPVFVSFSNEDRVQATIVGKDDSTDTALLKVTESADALRPLALGTSTSVDVGDPVVAIGNPFGLDRTITSGIVSAVARQIEAPNGFPINNAIQTDAAINHGNSGGPLLNMQGQVIGINSQIADSGIDANVGVGFAIPIDMVKQIATDLQKNGKVTHAWLGVALAPIDPALADEVKLAANKGAMVQTVQPGSPAATAGLKASTDQKVIGGETYAIGGDIIIAVDGKPVESITELQSAIQEHRAGDVVKLTVARAGGAKADLSVTLGAQPTSAAAG